MRRTKTVNDSEITYDYVDDMFVHESGSNYDLYYAYDDNGLLVKLTYVKNGTSTEYYVTTNNSGDVEAIYSSIGVLQARYYDASTGRFISTDDTDYISEDILGTNIYAYCSNNPVMNSDPGG